MFLQSFVSGKGDAQGLFLNKIKIKKYQYHLKKLGL